MQKYNLGFISDKDIFCHVRETVMKYRRSINLREFNHNIVDPIKLTFDAKIYNQSMEQTIMSECIRQIDKSNNNAIGYFHQHLFNYAGNGWEVPLNGEKGGFDVINEPQHIFVEMKNKHNTMNYAGASTTYMKMQNKILHDDQAKCFLVEVIATRSQNRIWNVSISKDGRREHFAHERIRRISIDKFYEVVFGDKQAFFKLCKALPSILDDVIATDKTAHLEVSVYNDLGGKDFYKSLYLLAFSTYEGFDKF